MHMKKVLFTVGTLFGGGAERVVSLWTNELCRLGYNVAVLVNYRMENEYAVPENVPIHAIAVSNADYLQMNFWQRLYKMRCIIREQKPDVVINFLPAMQIMMMVASLGIKVRRLETVRVSPWIVFRNDRKRKILWDLCFQCADNIILQTAEQGEYFNKRLQKKCVVIPNPVSQQCYDAYKTDYMERTADFIAAGRITPQKNYPMMIHAIARAQEKCPDIRLSIYGTGEESYLQELKNLVHSLNMDDVITFEGRSNKIPEEMRKRDAFLMTSNYEGMPNALIEAMATGLVCVSTNCRTGPKDLITHEENGFLIAMNDADAAAGVICRIAGMAQNERKAIGYRARESVLAICSQEASRDRLAGLIENT